VALSAPPTFALTPNFLDSGGNSLKAVYLAATIQDEFAVPVDAIEIIEQGNLRQGHRR
jgi:phosphopantetheine binding protein